MGVDTELNALLTWHLALFWFKWKKNFDLRFTVETFFLFVALKKRSASGEFEPSKQCMLETRIIYGSLEA